MGKKYKYQEVEEYKVLALKGGFMGFPYSIGTSVLFDTHKYQNNYKDILCICPLVNEDS